MLQSTPTALEFSLFFDRFPFVVVPGVNVVEVGLEPGLLAAQTRLLLLLDTAMQWLELQELHVEIAIVRIEAPLVVLDHLDKSINIWLTKLGLRLVLSQLLVALVVL
jgi:hypothetical protein